ncbi:MAG: zf-HC2 domain-containing protein [Microbacteriaceae bacterium]|nr:zf-HC2 domain-containing protein [Microbacteriaceae bacterium]MCL2794826.1 zf-HC2 domain-containing protein [Microbacteriaceae bacterium]
MTEDARAELHEWDAAYVLGALSAADRRLFELHLEGCAECRMSVAELAVMPALLAQVPEAEALGHHSLRSVDRRGATDDPAGRLRPPGRMETPQPAPPSLRALAHRVRRHRTRRRWLTAGIAALAAAAIAAAVVLPTALDTPPAPTTALTLAQTAPSPLSATVDLTAHDWGTALAMDCRYDSPPGAYATTGHYALYVTDASGQASRVASWSASPGTTIRASGAVDTPIARLRTVEIRDASSGAVLLSAPVN